MQIKARVEDDFELEAWVEQMIAENGYAQISMHDPASKLPGFAFTIGLEQSRQIPELFCMGVAPDIAAQLFAICIEGHDGAVCDLSKGNQSVEGLVKGHSLRFRWVGSAMVLKANEVRQVCRDDIGKMVQVLLQDDHGFFPGDMECDPRVAVAQDPDRLVAPTLN